MNIPLMEFHVSRKSRDRYQFDESLFSLSGNVIFANFHAARLFSQKINARRDLVSFPEQAIRASQINALGLIDEILHFVIGTYRQERSPKAMDSALAYLNGTLGREIVDQTLRQFTFEFPPLAVYRREIDPETFLAGETAGVPNRQLILEEMLMLWLANANPAFGQFIELFDDSSLEKTSAYPEMIRQLGDFFKTQPSFGPDHQTLVEMLRSPAVAVPYSLQGQLEYIRSRWGFLLGRYLYRLLSSLDLIKEEEKAIFIGLGGAGPSRVYEFAGQEREPERFSPDREWMPNLILIAKNSYVWLDQLSKKYKRPITRLDLIPEEELDTLSRWGFTGLWLIGLWERSAASKRIKQLRGNQDAVASAYSLFSYDIAADLGGEEAFIALRDRAWKRGIRLASDMVPNHMGIDSRWVIEHPDWFIALNYSPFPSYSFNGPNLSWDDRVGIYLEDHYYNNSDAAVVFKRVDNWTGSEKYVYHGNDGTSMPWNDTAQLDYLKAEVREAVIQTILGVARRFPVIRFDAAMTLAKKHYQRLWYPEPGSGGDIPSRAGQGLTRDNFDAAIPIEFWREVVDRVAQEVPDTLLLAEAFWLMEGYFVRTLGMHRVYNSAFMNMLRDEKNQEYRLVIKNTLEFEPEILKRYVNFMNNPDERTAIDQFGNGDKYFGVCTLLVTMPGLPMFGHGQVEGLTEKYGMEFRRAYWDEHPDGNLVERHEREIFPLVRRRYLFAEAHNFLLYDFYTQEGFVNEDVFAYSNRAGEERSIVLFNNKFNTTRGWIRNSAAFPEKGGPEGERVLVQKTLGQGLGLHDDSSYFTIFRDQITGLEYIRNSQELCRQGYYAELEAYKCQVLLDFSEVLDNDWHQYTQLAAYLNGRGVPSIDTALKEIFLQPVHAPFRELFNQGMLNWMIQNRWRASETGQPAEPPENLEKVLDEAEHKLLQLFTNVRELTNSAVDEASLAAEVRAELQAALALPALTQILNRDGESPDIEYLIDGLNSQRALQAGDPAAWGSVFAWLFTHKLGKVLSEVDYGNLSRTWIDEWLLGKIIAGVLQEMGLEEAEANRCVAVARLLAGQGDWCAQAGAALSPYRTLKSWLQDSEVQRFISINRYQGILWFNKEAFEELLWWQYLAVVIGLTAPMTEQAISEEQIGPAAAGEEEVEVDETVKPPHQLSECFEVIQNLLEAEEKSGYKVEKLLDATRD